MMHTFRLILIIFGLLVSVAPLSAQDTTVDDCAVEAQAWYDAIGMDITIDLVVTLTQESGASTEFKEATFQVWDSELEEMAAAEYPECVEAARAWYVEGVHYVREAYHALNVNRDMVGFAPNMIAGSQLIGQFRGYLAALGVDIDIRPNVSIYSK